MIYPEWTSKYIGLPFEKYNCWQLLCKIYREQFGIALPTYDDEYLNALDRGNIKMLYEREVPISWTKCKTPQIGDAVLMRLRGQPWHVGVVVSRDSMIHTERGLEAVIERFTGPNWKNNIIGFYRYDR